MDVAVGRANNPLGTVDAWTAGYHNTIAPWVCHLTLGLLEVYPSAHRPRSHLVQILRFCYAALIETTGLVWSIEPGCMQSLQDLGPLTARLVMMQGSDAV